MIERPDYKRIAQMQYPMRYLRAAGATIRSPFSVEGYGVAHHLLDAEHLQVAAYNVEGKVAGLGGVARRLGKVVREVARGLVDVGLQCRVGGKLQDDMTRSEGARNGFWSRRALPKAKLA